MATWQSNCIFVQLCYNSPSFCLLCNEWISSIWCHCSYNMGKALLHLKHQSTTSTSPQQGLGQVPGTPPWTHQPWAAMHSGKPEKAMTATARIRSVHEEVQVMEMPMAMKVHPMVVCLHQAGSPYLPCSSSLGCHLALVEADRPSLEGLCLQECGHRLLLLTNSRSQLKGYLLMLSLDSQQH